MSSVRFHLCASRGRLDCLEVIISHGVDVSVTDGAGMISDYGKHVMFFKLRIASARYANIYLNFLFATC